MRLAARGDTIGGYSTAKAVTWYRSGAVPQSIAIKARYVLQHRLGGIMFWELSEYRDDELLDVINRGLRH